MADRNSAKIGEAFTLDAQFERAGVSFDIGSITKVEIQDFSFRVIETILTTNHLGLGQYRVNVPALGEAGTFYDVWYYYPVTSGSLSQLTNTVVVADVEGAQGETASPPPAPAAGVDNLCLLSGTFFDAGGNPFQGIYIKFTPILHEERMTSVGFVARDITAQTDANGYVSFYIFRGLRGILSITGLGTVREVTIPDTAAASIFDVISATQDPFEIQKLDFVELPRSS